MTRCLLFFLLIVGTPTAFAQDGAQAAAVSPPTPAQTLERLGSQLATVKRELKDKQSAVPLADLRASALSVQDQARQLATSLAPRMTAIQAQLAVLGAAPEKGSPPEAAEVAVQRRQLNKAQSELDAQIKQAQLLNQDATQLAAQITGARNDEFQARLASRTATPFSSTFWREPARTLPDDMARLDRLGGRYIQAVRVAWQPPNRQPLLWCLIAAAVLLAVGRWLLERLWLRLTANHVPNARLRRSAMAAAVTLTAVFTTGLAAQLIYLGLNWNNILDRDLAVLASSAVGLITAAAFVTGLGRALLSVARPSWRVPMMSDSTARRLRRFPWWFGAATLAFGLLERISRTIGTSLPATVATRGLMALVISGLIGLALVQWRRARKDRAGTTVEPETQPVWAGLLVLTATLGLVISWAGVATGYIALAFFVAVQMLWTGVIAVATYLLIHLVADLIDSVLSPGGLTGQRLQTGFRLEPKTLEQGSVLLTGMLKVGLVLLAMATVLTPFGAGPGDLLSSARRTLGNVGDLAIHPGTIFSGLAVLVIGMLVLRMLKKWAREKLFPASRMEPGLQDSILTLLGYVGGLLVVVFALLTLHVDLKSITWIVSALSVGIGFGLQAIVQNFISGLILLVERPVKVGDWVSLSSDVEGDIRRINVRATEIQLWDRSTVIVPNSQLITQNVRNVTLGNALGRVLIKLPLPLDTDANKVRAMVLDVLSAHADTLPVPAPVVLLDNLAAGAMNFNCIGYLSSPRDVSRVRSELLFEILERLRRDGVSMVIAQNMLVRRLSPTIAPDDATD